jgi:hypothetical protein
MAHSRNLPTVRASPASRHPFFCEPSRLFHNTPPPGERLMGPHHQGLAWLQGFWWGMGGKQSRQEPHPFSDPSSSKGFSFFAADSHGETAGGGGGVGGRGRARRGGATSSQREDGSETQRSYIEVNAHRHAERDREGEIFAHPAASPLEPPSVTSHGRTSSSSLHLPPCLIPHPLFLLHPPKSVLSSSHAIASLSSSFLLPLPFHPPSSLCLSLFFSISTLNPKP